MNREQEDNLDNINGAPFLFTTAALSDVYEVIGKTSNAVQKPGMPSWEISSTVDTYIGTLKKMSSNLNGVSLESLDKGLFPT